MTIGEVSIILGADISGMVKALDVASKKVEAFGKTIEDAGKGFKDIGSTFSMYVSAPIIAGMGASLWAFAEQETAANSLAAALGRTGDALQVDKFRAFASELQRMTTQEDDAIVAAMALGKNIGIPTGQLELATKAAIGLSRTYGMDLQSAMQMVARASQGQTQMLARYGIVMDANMSDEEKYVELLRRGNEMMSNETAAVGTLAGSLTKLKNTFGDLMEDMGEFLNNTLRLPEALAWLGQKIEQLRAWWAGLSIEAKKWILVGAAIAAIIPPLIFGFGVVISVIGSLITSVGTIIGILPGIIAFAGAAIPIILAVAAAIGGVIFAIVQLVGEGDTFSEKFSNVFSSAKENAASFFQSLLEWGITAVEFLINTFQGMYIQIKYAFLQGWNIADWFFESIFTAVFQLTDYFTGFITWLATNFSDLWYNMGELVLQAVINMATNISDLFSAVWEKIMNPTEEFKMPEFKGLTEDAAFIEVPPPDFKDWSSAYRDLGDEMQKLDEERQGEMDSMMENSWGDRFRSLIEKMKGMWQGLGTTATDSQKGIVNQTKTSAEAAAQVQTIPTKFSAAAEVGSVEAYKAMINSPQSKAAEDTKKNTKDTAINTQKINENIQRMIEQGKLPPELVIK